MAGMQVAILSDKDSQVNCEMLLGVYPMVCLFVHGFYFSFHLSTAILSVPYCYIVQYVYRATKWLLKCTRRIVRLSFSHGGRLVTKGSKLGSSECEKSGLQVSSVAPWTY